jgi:4-amino-4-deoxy-L-arabinose transferase-like glycosyltransferase
MSLALTCLLARRLFGLTPFYALAAAAFLLTSLEQTVRLSVPLADIAAQLFTGAALWVALDGGREPEDPGAVRNRMLACGLLAGLAFVTRYTQLLLVPGLLYALYRRPLPPPGVRFTFVKGCARLTDAPPRMPGASLTRQLSFLFARFLPFGAAFFLVGLPDLVYRSSAFGSPLSFASGELAQFSARDIFPVTLGLLLDLARDFGLLVPFVLLGMGLHLRARPGDSLLLAAVLGPVVLFHLPYHYLKLRDLLFLMPVLCALAAMGVRAVAAGVQKAARVFWSAQRPAGGPPLAVLALAVVFVPLAARFASQLPMLEGYYTYGFLSAEGRAHVDSIAGLTPSNAVVAASLNSGAIDLYARRATFRPGHLLQPGRTWTDDELVAFVRALQARERPAYLLADSEEMDAPIAALESCCILVPIAELYLPYYYRDGSATNEIIHLYRIDDK